MEKGSKFKLPEQIEHYLGVLSRIYKTKGEDRKLSIIVNAKVQVIEDTSRQGWQDSVICHSLYLAIPQQIFLRVVNDRHTVQGIICNEINELHNLDHESIGEVRIEPAREDDFDWRLESGALEEPRRTIPVNAAMRIWGESGYRVFLSHKSEIKTEAAALKDNLELFGISAFVAHKDITPTKEWQIEIEAALETMDAFVALLTENYHDSLWTDQEVGFAVARGIPIIAFKLGQDPYGFIGKFQGLSCIWDEAPIKIVSLLIKNSKMLDAYIGVLPQCTSFENGLKLAQILPEIESLSMAQADQMVNAHNTNSDLFGCWGFSGANGGRYGKGLAYHLSRITGQRYVRGNNSIIERQ
jgi:hypothetical protein